MKNFNNNEFAFQIIAKGSYVDPGAGDGRVWIVETTTLRLNHVALNEFISAHTDNSPDCYETEAEWRAHVAEIEERKRIFVVKIANGLGIRCPGEDSIPRGFNVYQAQSEVFTAVDIYEKEISE